MYNINYIEYYIEVITTWLTQYITYLYDQFMEFSFIIKVAVISVTCSLMLIAFVSLRILYRGYKDYKWNKLFKRLDRKYGDGIRYVLSPEAPDKMNRQEVLDALEIDNPDKRNNDLPKKYHEKLALSRLVYHYRIAEEASAGRRRNLHIILDIFELQSFLEDLVNKGKMNLKAEALHMLRAFKIPINQWISNQFRNSKRIRVKRLAMYASIMTGSNSDMEYFETEFFDRNCCIYDEIQLGYVLQRRLAMGRKIPNLAQLALLQHVPSTQAVFVRLMHQFGQAENCHELEELFTHTHDKKLRQEICRTWGYLHYRESEELMQDMIPTQPDDVKISLMHAMTRLHTGKSLDVLVDGYKNNGDQLVKYEALRCLYSYGNAGREKFYELEAVAPEEDRRLFEFFNNSITRDESLLNEEDVYDTHGEENLYSVQ